jgi:uncharacterized 2Fe-2S/4Fe-4S cluster protein (DUF4445 family)
LKRFQIGPESGKSVLTLLRESGEGPVSPCGGKGTCGKCKVFIVSGSCGDVSDTEKKFLSESEIGNGCRLACMTVPAGPLEVLVPYGSSEQLGKGAWEKDFSRFAGEHDGWIQKKAVELEVPSMEDQRSELSRLRAHFPGLLLKPDLRLLTELTESLASDKRIVTIVTERDQLNDGDGRIVAVEPGNNVSGMYGCAVDIGTTTVAVYLADLEKNVPFDSLSRSNSQAVYGADVISRIGFCMEEGLHELAAAIRGQLREMISLIARRNGIKPDEIYRVSIVGNSTMIHLLTETDPSGIAMAPFIAVFTEELHIPAADLELGIHPAACAYIVPAISAYVGGDIVAGILSSGIMDFAGTALFLDIGTNGEIILKHEGRYIACSTAAGPAFEGAKIRWGTGGENGAIDSFSFTEVFQYTTIGQEPPIGICGAGLVDIIAVLLRNGIIDRKGKLLSGEELRKEHKADLSVIEKFLSRLSSADGKPVFIAAGKEETAVKEDIYVSRKDIREVQLAKAAIAAGIESLLDIAGIDPADIGRVYLAGGFGSFVNKESAADIGLIPEKMAEKTEVVGNAAGKGALHALFSRKHCKVFEQILERTRYIELSGNPGFNTLFMKHIRF